MLCRQNVVLSFKAKRIQLVGMSYLLTQSGNSITFAELFYVPVRSDLWVITPDAIHWGLHAICLLFCFFATAVTILSFFSSSLQLYTLKGWSNFVSLSGKRLGREGSDSMKTVEVSVSFLILALWLASLSGFIWIYSNPTPPPSVLSS